MFTFRAMNTDVRVAAPHLADDDEASLATRVAVLFAQQEAMFSRFDEESELTRLNRACAPTVVSPPVYRALRRARRYFDLTHGIFDPTIATALTALGYDRSFEPGVLDRETTAAPVRTSSFADIALDDATRTVDRPAHVQIDLGGMIKGHTADLAADLLPKTAFVDAGGDAVARGQGTDNAGWLVDIEDPFDASRVLASVRLRDRAVATSAGNRRRWVRGRDLMHHLVDPRTSRSASSDLAQVTVVARRAELADVLAKTAFILGARESRRVLRDFPDAGALLVRNSGAWECVGAMEVEDA